MRKRRQSEMERMRNVLGVSESKRMLTPAVGEAATGVASGAASRHTCRASSAPPSGSHGRRLAEAEAAAVRVEAAARRRAARPTKDRGSIEHFRSRDSERQIEERRQLTTEDLIIHYHSAELLLLPSMAVACANRSLTALFPYSTGQRAAFLSIYRRKIQFGHGTLRVGALPNSRRSEKATAACVLAWCVERPCAAEFGGERVLGLH
jgi:hypothetical protein